MRANGRSAGRRRGALWNHIRAVLAVLLVFLTLPGCDDDWDQAQAAFERHDIEAYRLYLETDPTTPDGREARARLAEADAHYRAGIERLEEDDDTGFLELGQGLARAPIDPDLYLPLARQLARRGFHERATDCYLKYLALRPRSTEAANARRELHEIPPEPEVIAALAQSAEETEGASPIESPLRLIALGIACGVLLAGAIAGLALFFSQRGVSLEKLAGERPELHPAIAYLIGSMRHELLKHRIGAASDAVAALAGGSPSQAQLAFLRERLFGGEPLDVAFAGHVKAFERALGQRLRLRGDPRFRRAGRAIARLLRIEPALGRGDPRAIDALHRAHGELRSFDRELGDLATRLVRTSVDEPLLRSVLDEVRAEHSTGSVQLDEVRVAAPRMAIAVEVFRFDLVLVLKNVVRNAILSMGKSRGQRRLAIDIATEVLPTGEELVRIRVLDTSEERLTTEAIYDRSVDRGLGLVTAALARYDGSIAVEAGEAGYEKSVTLRFFRALC